MNFVFLPLSHSSLIGGRGIWWIQVDKSVKLILFTLRGLMVKVSEFRVKFDEVCEWFDGCDILKNIFKS